MDTEQKDTALAETLETNPGSNPESGQITNSTAQIGQDASAQEPPKDAPKEESPQAMRFKTLREAREKAERERDQLRQQLEAMRNQPQNIPHSQAQEEVPPSPLSIAPDDLVEGRHLSRYDQEIKALREELQRTRQEASVMSVESRLKAQYRDFDSVVNKENIEVLQRMHPEIAATIQSSPDLYGKAVTAYTLLKKFGIAGSTHATEQAARIDQNLAKPQTAMGVRTQSTQDSPLAHANQFGTALSEQRKSEVYAEMQKILRGQ